MPTPIQPVGSQTSSYQTPIDTSSVKLLNPTEPVKNIVQIQSSIITIQKNIEDIRGKEMQINNNKQAVTMGRTGYPAKFDYSKYEKEIIKLEDEIKILKANIRKNFEFLSKEIEKNPQGVILTLANVPGSNPLKTFCWDCLNAPQGIDGLHQLQKAYFTIRRMCSEDVKKTELGIAGKSQRDGQAFGSFFGSILAASKDTAAANKKEKEFLKGVEKTFSVSAKVGPVGINIVELIKTLAVAFGTEKANDLKDSLFTKDAPPHPLHGIKTDYPDNYNSLEKGFGQGFSEFTSEFM